MHTAYTQTGIVIIIQLETITKLVFAKFLWCYPKLMNIKQCTWLAYDFEN